MEILSHLIYIFDIDGPSIQLNSYMRANDFITEKQLQEIDAKKLKQMAAAGLLGTAVSATPISKISDIDMDRNPTQIQTTNVDDNPPQTQTTNVDDKDTVDTLPDNLADLTIPEKKKQFFGIVIPLIKKANQEILEQKQRLVSLKNKKKISEKDQAWLNKMFGKYKIKDRDFGELLRRVDIVPTSLAAAQAAIESGWGTSRFAKQGNSLFGQRDYSGGGMKPKGASGFTVGKFDSIFDSIQSYMRNLNTHSAYSQFRQNRAAMRNANKKIDGIGLAKTLGKYSERGTKYINDVVSIIKSNNLS